MNSLPSRQSSLQLAFAPCVMSLSPHTAFIPTISYASPFWSFPGILVHSIYHLSVYMYNIRFTLLMNFKMYNMLLLSCCFSVTQLCVTLCSPIYCCMASLSLTISQNLFKLMPIGLMMPSNHLILCCPLLLLPSIFLSIRVFSNESALHIR